VEDAQGDLIDVGDLQVQVAFDVLGATEDEPGTPIRQTFNLNVGEAGSVVNTITQFAETSSTKAFKQNGYGMGYLDNFKIDQSGVITGVYSNGTNRTLGQIAMATFTNQNGLEKAGETTFVVTNNSGDPDIGPSGIAGKGKIIAGALEMSNVDLAEQFTDMIVTQRGFQANSKTITTSDTMLQELLNLKR
jgi:flagellar hook protein FlgE